MTRLITINIKVPQNIYEELERRARIVGTNVEVYVRTLIEKNISRSKRGVGGLNVREVDLVLKFRHMIKRACEMTERGPSNVKMSSVCLADIAHIIKNSMDRIESEIVNLCRDVSLKSCPEYQSFLQLSEKIRKTFDPLEKVRLLIRYREDVVIGFLKELFFMERCSLYELATILHGTTGNAMAKLIMALLDIDRWNPT
uniref:Ribbon-helix-helix protein, CopG family n=1 Tax=Ignisphaera aggregans TaxID=334771 RepID=A0A7C2Z8Q6_9CREN